MSAMRAAWRAGWLFGLGIGVGCADLPAIDRGACGNAVVEGQEDCDGFAAFPGTVCRPRGTKGECRYDCSEVASGKHRPCPEGWGCGSGDLCRRPTGRFAAVGDQLATPIGIAALGDFDGDGKQDVLGVEPTRTRVHYLDDGGVVARTVSLPASLPIVSIGDVDGDGLADAAFNARAGIAVATGRKDRTLETAAYPTLTAPLDWEFRFFAANVLPAEPGSEILLLIDHFKEVPGCATACLGYEKKDGTPGALLSLDFGVADLAGDVVVGNVLDEAFTSPCEDLVLARRDAAGVVVFSPCRPGPGGFRFNEPGPDQIAPVTIKLPAGYRVTRGALVVDVDADGHADVLVGASNAPGADAKNERTLVAYATGTNRFRSDLGKADPDDAAGGITLGGGSQALPLAAGHLDIDGKLDVVHPHGIWVSSLGAVPASAGGCDATYCNASIGPGKTGWTVARIGNFDANLIPDVACGSADFPGVDYFSGYFSGGQFGYLTRFQIPTDAGVGALAAGDFDGDLLNDLAFVERGRAGGGISARTDDAVKVAFGRAAGAPEAPVLAGRFPKIVQLAATTYGGFVSDVVADLGVLSERELAGNHKSLSVAILQGSTDRLLLAPLGLSELDVGASYNGLPYAIALGRWEAGGATGVAAIAKDVPTPQGAKSVHRLWLAPASPTEGLGQPHFSDPLPGDPAGEDALLASGDVDGDGRDELVVAVPVQGGTQTAILLARSETQQGKLRWKWSDADRGLVAQPMKETYSKGFPRLAVVDLDANGAADIVFLPNATAGVHVFWNRGDGTFDFLVADIARSGPEGAVHVAWLNAGARREKDLVVMDWSEGAAGLYVIPTRGGRLGAAARILDSNGIPLPVARREHAAMRAGDVNGDGVDDIVLVGSSGLTVYLGVPEHR